MKKAILITTGLVLALLGLAGLTACDGHNDKYPKDYLGFERFLENYTFERGVESREITLKVVAAEKADTERKATISIRNLPGRQPAYTLLDKEVTIAPKKKSAHVRIRIYPAKIKKADEIRLTCTPKDKKVKATTVTLNIALK